jgi:hypothetical protein
MCNRTQELFAVFCSCLLVATSAVAAEPAKVDLSELKLLDLHGERHVLSRNDVRGSAFVFLSIDCPISRQYIPELNRLAKVAGDHKLAFYAVVSGSSTRAEATKFVDEFHVAFPVLFDASAELATLFGPDHVPEAFVVDRVGGVQYRGRIDDVYADVDKRRAEPGCHDLCDAISAVADGKSVAKPRTEAVGCPFEAPEEKMGAAQVTYARDIAPLIFAHCAECHRPGEVAPFSLLTYQDAAKRAKGLVRVTERRLMPPWRADVHYGQFLDARRLTEREIALVKAWADAGAPEGDLADLPPQPKFPNGWRLGTPDMVVSVPVRYSIPADGPDIFQHFVMPLNLPKDETVVGFEFRPGNPAVVHHAIVAIDTRGGARARDAQTPEPGWRTSGSIDASITGILGVWTPGMTPRFYPEDVGIALDKSADLVVQLHLHPTGKAETDQSKIALYLAKKPIKRVISRAPLLLGTLVIEIPPGEPRYRTGSSVVLPVDCTLTSVFPHMHMIGKEMKVTATLPDKSVKPLIWIKDWNFFWQDSYVYREPVKLPKGTRVTIEAIYDNTATNPFNPHRPPTRVLFGNDTTDEMCFALFQTVADGKGAQRRMGGSMMRQFFEEWQTAKLSPDARVKILSEAMKLFGGGMRARQQPAHAESVVR